MVSSCSEKVVSRPSWIDPSLYTSMQIIPLYGVLVALILLRSEAFNLHLIPYFKLKNYCYYNIFINL